MSANDSEHFARESRSPPGTPHQKTHPSQRGVGFLFGPDLSQLSGLAYHLHLCDIRAEQDHDRLQEWYLRSGFGLRAPDS